MQSPRVQRFTYDGLLRLTDVVDDRGPDQHFGYDLAGNRTSVQIDSGTPTTFSYNNANQVNGWAYDNAGNLQNDGTTSYGYDALDRLKQAAPLAPGRPRISYTYNGDGVLVMQASGGSLFRYTQDLASSLPQVLQQSFQSTTNYIYGLDRLGSLSGRARTWDLTDGLGSVRVVLDNAGVPLDAPRFDAWGVPQDGATPDPFGFTGEVQDNVNGLVYLRARWYNPNVGTFTSRDPFAGFLEQPYSTHPYQYGYSSPTNYADPSGRNPLCLAPLLTGIGVPASAACFVVAGVVTLGLGAYATYQAWQCAQRSCLVQPVQQLANNFKGNPDDYRTRPAPVPLTKPAPQPVPAPVPVQRPDPNPPQRPIEIPALPDLIDCPDPAPGPQPAKPTPFGTPTPTPKRELPIVVVLGPGWNSSEVEAILAHPNYQTYKVVAIDSQPGIDQFLQPLVAKYGSDRLEVLIGRFNDPQILSGRKATQMFSIYPDSSATHAIAGAVSNHLVSGGKLYVVTEQDAQLSTIAQSIAPLVSTANGDYYRSQGVSSSSIEQGQNGPGVGFSSTYTGQGGTTVYDLWTTRR